MCSLAPFNNDKYAAWEMIRIIKKFNINTFIETGTFKGISTFFIADYVPNVISIEGNLDFYKDVVSRNTKKNVDLRLGNSGNYLEKLLQDKPEGNILFYLDAHWEGYWPLKDELAAIANHKKDDCIIVIDDFEVPDRPDINFDTYGGIKNNYEYIKSDLDKVYPNGYTYYYNNKYEHKEYTSGKIFIFPKKWDCSGLYITNPNNGVNYSKLVL